ncbi:MAG: hypothetical protein LBU46_03140 [Candidatus Accumulibacter sp.]|jgi:hypothetical protein|nr:hypothetical protein [Accumulibacter sp.]
MKFGTRDLPRLWASLLALALMFAVGGGVIAVSRDKISGARMAFSAARAERNEIDGKLRQIRGEENEIRQKAAVFNRLRARGVAGEEQRLEWVELLKEIRERHRLIEIGYEFTPRHALDDAPAGSLGLYASTMKLQVRLLHEQDLIRLLDDLRQKAPALIQVKRCDVTRRTGVDNASQGLLQADCLIDWITLHEAGKGGGNAE